jgi:hypothetical protein
MDWEQEMCESIRHRKRACKNTTGSTDSNSVPINSHNN